MSKIVKLITGRALYCLSGVEGWGANSKGGGTNLIFWSIFLRFGMKKKFGPRGLPWYSFGSATANARTLDRMLVCK